MDVIVNCDWQYYQQAITKIWKILEVENYEQAKGKTVDELVAELKQQRDALQEFARNFFEWHANHFEDFNTEINAQLLSLANTAEPLIV